MNLYILKKHLLSDFFLLLFSSCFTLFYGFGLYFDFSVSYLVSFFLFSFSVGFAVACLSSDIKSLWRYRLNLALVPISYVKDEFLFEFEK